MWFYDKMTGFSHHIVYPWYVVCAVNGDPNHIMLFGPGGPIDGTESTTLYYAIDLADAWMDTNVM